jgi:hypothetical protein
LQSPAERHDDRENHGGERVRAEHEDPARTEHRGRPAGRWSRRAGCSAPEASAYAMPTGTSIVVSTRPATTSPRSQRARIGAASEPRQPARESAALG